jgi:hypothetical protein
MQTRRTLLVCDTVHSEGGLAAVRPVTRVAARDPWDRYDPVGRASLP